MGTHKATRSGSTKLVHVTTVPMSFAFFIGQISYMKERGFDVHGLTSPGKFTTSFLKVENIPIHSVSMKRSITPFRDLISIFCIWRKFRKIRPQIVHSHTPKGGLLGMIGAWLARVPIRIYHIHGLPMLTATGYRRLLLKLSEIVACRLSHQVICLSYSMYDAAMENRLCPPGKAKVLASGSSNGVDACVKFNPEEVGYSARSSIRARYNIPDDALVLGFVGRIVRDKGVAELAAAWQVLSREYPNLHLLMVGPFEDQDPLPSEAEQVLRNDSRIHLVGVDWDTPPYYASMDLLALPTYREGFGAVCIEAAAMGLPVVATRIPGCVDAVVDRTTGILIPPRDVEALVEAIRAYLDSPVLRRQHGDAGRERVLEEFRQEVIWEALYQEYLRLMKEKGLPVPNRNKRKLECVS